MKGFADIFLQNSKVACRCHHHVRLIGKTAHSFADVIYSTTPSASTWLDWT
jgi:hypothetical protein